MIYFFGNINEIIYAVQSKSPLTKDAIKKLNWLFENQPLINKSVLTDFFVGPRITMVTPWSTNAVEITQNMGISGITRIEKFEKVAKDFSDYDAMIYQKFTALNQSLFDINSIPEPIKEIEDIAAYNIQEGLSLNDEEILYLENLSKKINRKLTDSEVFGFSQVNSEHCRHKIFNGTFIIDGKEMPASLFQLIKETSKQNPDNIISAYKDNVAFLKGPKAIQFAPKIQHRPDFYTEDIFDSVLSLKAETHNFPTTVEPFNGAATGSGGEIRDRLAGGQGSLPLAGTAVYMTSYARLENTKSWEQKIPPRNWLYQTPLDILIKASNGASDFGNKFGQPLIAGSVFTFEHLENNTITAFDKVIMLAGGIGYGKKEQALKKTPKPGDSIVVLGGDNYRIGMGGAAVSSADTGNFESGIELNAIQRSNPEMQKRVANAVRAMVENNINPIVSIHDHGAGGHLNCLSELVEDTGGKIDIDKLPIGDPTLSDKEIIGNESQERMGLVISKNDIEVLREICKRERVPFYEVGEVTGDHRFTFYRSSTGEKPMDLLLEDMFGSSPKTILNDVEKVSEFKNAAYNATHIYQYLKNVLQLEAVACKDWLTNKVDRCVGGKVAKQQCVGALQLPLNNCGVMALDYKGKNGIATALGHAPASALINPQAGSKIAITEALTNIVWAPLENGIKSVSLSANWMWPCKNEGEDARLYKAVKAVSDFAIALGLNIPTGKDSLSMKQKYPDKEVLAPGTVIISAAAHCNNINQVVEPILQHNKGSIYYINISQDAYKLGGSSFFQTQNAIGNEVPTVTDAKFVIKAFNTLQKLISEGKIVAGHDIASGGLITTLLELCFANPNTGATIDLSTLKEKDSVKLLFSENCGVVFQAADDASVEKAFSENNVQYFKIGKVSNQEKMHIKNQTDTFTFDIPEIRDTWFKTSYLLDQKQCANNKATDRFNNYKKHPLTYKFPKEFTGKLPNTKTTKPIAAVLREKGSNSERELAHALFLAGFDVKDVHMTDLISGKETLEDVQFIGAVGGFSNSDVLGSAKGWAGAFLYNPKAKEALDNFLKREDTLSVGICNGCQLFMELEIINPEHDVHGKMTHNDSKKHESGFTSVTINKNNSVMLSNFEGSTLGVWISHGEGKFRLPQQENEYNIVAKYGYDSYPANPNGSDYNTAMLCSKDGRHLVMMPHIERSIFTWNWAYYPTNRKDEVSPWIQAFVNARKWIEKQKH
jgi:phosphoribosylformylglycinamidine synthase